LAWRRLIEHPQQWILGGCVAVLLWLIGSEIWLTSRAFLSLPSASSTPAAGTAADRSHADQIVAAQLFGRAPAQAAGGAVPQTDMQLTLRGVFTAADPRNASAMLETGDGKMQIVKQGSNVAPDTTLEQVTSSHIVLLRNGGRESLYFPTPQPGDATPAEGMPPASAGAGEDTQDSPPAGASPEELKRAAILRRLEELRARSSQ
jgi:type II secretory pathway component PulC